MSSFARLHDGRSFTDKNEMLPLSEQWQIKQAQNWNSELDF